MEDQNDLEYWINFAGESLTRRNFKWVYLIKHKNSVALGFGKIHISKLTKLITPANLTTALCHSLDRMTYMSLKCMSQNQSLEVGRSYSDTYSSRRSEQNNEFNSCKTNITIEKTSLQAIQVKNPSLSQNIFVFWQSHEFNIWAFPLIVLHVTVLSFIYFFNEFFYLSSSIHHAYIW